MVFRITHIHVKSADPRATAEWYVEAFRFRILSDTVRPRFGDRFIRCETEDGGAIVNFSGAQEGEHLPPGTPGVHLGLEHFGIESNDIEADVERLIALGAELVEGPVESRPGRKIAFLNTPADVRVELMQDF